MHGNPPVGGWDHPKVLIAANACGITEVRSVKYIFCDAAYLAWRLGSSPLKSLLVGGGTSVGIYGSTFDLLVMIGFGGMGWVLRKLDVPLVPIILGTLLGNAMENNLRRAVTLDNGDWWTLVDSPRSICLWAIAIIGFVLPLIVGARVKARMHKRRDEEGSISD